MRSPQHVSSAPDPGPLSDLRNLDFARFVLGELYLTPGVGNVEFATNLSDYRFSLPRATAHLAPTGKPEPDSDLATGDELA